MSETSADKSSSKTKFARIISTLTGKLVAGTVVENHPDGEVTILFAGMRRKGLALSNADILALEAGTYEAKK